MSETLNSQSKAAILAEARKAGVWIKASGIFIVQQTTGKSFEQIIEEALSSPGVNDPDDDTNRNWVLIVKGIFKKYGLL